MAIPPFVYFLQGAPFLSNILALQQLPMAPPDLWHMPVRPWLVRACRLLQKLIRVAVQSISANVSSNENIKVVIALK